MGGTGGIALAPMDTRNPVIRTKVFMSPFVSYSRGPSGIRVCAGSGSVSGRKSGSLPWCYDLQAKQDPFMLTSRAAGAFAAGDAVELLEEAFAIEFGADEHGIVIQAALILVAEVDTCMDQDGHFLGLAMLLELGHDFEAARASHLDA